jgi:aminopeptidase
VTRTVSLPVSLARHPGTRGQPSAGISTIVSNAVIARVPGTDSRLDREEALVRYTPSHEHLVRYAEVLVGFALGGGAGIARGDVVHVTADESAKPLYVELCRAVWRAGGHVIGDYRPGDDQTHNLSRDFYEIADGEQLAFFPERYRRGLLDQSDHQIYIRGGSDPHALQGVDPAKILQHRRALSPLVGWQTAKESSGELTWTVALYGTDGMAGEAGMPIEQYWRQIIDACFLGQPDPIASWRRVSEQIAGYTEQLNALPIERVHVEGEDVDLWLTLGAQRRWVGGGGRNIPSFEIFTSPDWRGTEGWIRFSEPLYIYGALVTGIELEFHAGRLTRTKADQGESLLGELLSTERSDRVGEFSLTDRRLSPITRFMADTLYDENVGGPFGNTHIAMGNSLHHCYDGDPEPLSATEWEHLGFNESAVHTDIVSTTDRVVTAVMSDGSRRTIYQSGCFELQPG